MPHLRNSPQQSRSSANRGNFFVAVDRLTLLRLVQAQPAPLHATDNVLSHQRRIFDNWQTRWFSFFSILVPIAGLALVPLIFDWPLILMPVHIVFLELIIDPACSIAFEAEPEEADPMGRPPRDPSAPLFGTRDILRSLLQGSAVFALALYQGYGEADGRTLTFVTLILGMIGLIFANRSRSRAIYRALGSPNRAFRWVVGGALGFLGAVVYVPALRNLFRFSPLHPAELALCCAAAAVSFLAIELLETKHR